MAYDLDSEELEATKALISKLPPEELEEVVGGMSPHMRNILIAAGLLVGVTATGLIIANKFGKKSGAVGNVFVSSSANCRSTAEAIGPRSNVISPANATKANNLRKNLSSAEKKEADKIIRMSPPEQQKALKTASPRVRKYITLVLGIAALAYGGKYIYDWQSTPRGDQTGGNETPRGNQTGGNETPRGNQTGGNETPRGDQGGESDLVKPKEGSSKQPVKPKVDHKKQLEENKKPKVEWFDVTIDGKPERIAISKALIDKVGRENLFKKSTYYESGWLGPKTKKDFFEYDGDKKIYLMSQCNNANRWGLEPTEGEYGVPYGALKDN